MRSAITVDAHCFTPTILGRLSDSANGKELVPIGKAYSGITDEELAQLDRYVRDHTINRFGPLRQAEYNSDKGPVLEIAFEGINWSGWHKSGIALRFPRINRIRWDKPARDADRIGVLEGLLREAAEGQNFPARVRKEG
jgi:DNA ligase-1